MLWRRAFSVGRRLPRLSEALRLEKVERDARYLKEKFRHLLQRDTTDFDDDTAPVDHIHATLPAFKARDQDTVTAEKKSFIQDDYVYNDAQQCIEHVFSIAGIELTKDLVDAISSTKSYIGENFSYLYTKYHNDVVQHQIVLSLDSSRRRTVIYGMLHDVSSMPKGRQHLESDWLLVKLPFAIYVHIMSPSRRESVDLESLYCADAFPTLIDNNEDESSANLINTKFT
jgi:ribosomal silencing factor RsfS